METESECELCASVPYPRITEPNRHAARAQGGGWRPQTGSLSWKALQLYFCSQGAAENCRKSKPHSESALTLEGRSARSVSLGGLEGLLSTPLLSSAREEILGKAAVQQPSTALYS